MQGAIIEMLADLLPEDGKKERRVGKWERRGRRVTRSQWNHTFKILGISGGGVAG